MKDTISFAELFNLKFFITMKSLRYVLFFLFMTSIFTSCKKDDENLDPTTGDLTVNVRDGAGASIVAETVYLYTSETNFNDGTYAKTATTNNSGQVTFLELSPQKYWVDAEFETTTGDIIILEGTGTVVAGKVTTIDIFP